MAKALFHRNQKVWVDSVGAWAVVERIVPTWARGFDEPVRIAYDVGLGREFLAHELRCEEESADAEANAAKGGTWRVMRARNKWQQPEDCAHHPHPGSFPVVVTDSADWGGWRVPGAEYDRDPARIEFQARLMVEAPRLLKLARDLMAMVDESAGDAPAELQSLAQAYGQIVRRIEESPAAPVAQTQPIAKAS
ncbi:MAG TPA: hypothetical protein VMU59_09080 [Caulobacteraceae bacterium]|nr:hypothetical protein [Caulobacteraceae bacterium]